MLKYRISFLALLLLACNNFSEPKRTEVNRAFYFWKSVFKLNDTEKTAIKNLNIKTLYLKFFDVDWNNNLNKAIPVAQLSIPDISFLKNDSINIVPTIFITNETIFKIEMSEIEGLSKKITLLTRQMADNASLNKIVEMQLDCDWTATTKDKYFALLQFLKQQNSTIKFSATIRLHQIKFAAKTGIPPVSKGMLMCYNMGNLTNINTQNSIIDIDEMQKYIGSLKNYPLRLDVVFPLFEWKVLFRNNQFKGLLQNLPDSLLSSNNFYKNDHRYTAKNDILFQGYEIKKDDVLRDEKSDFKTVLEASNIINKNVQNATITVALFHLDNLTLKKYTAYEMESIYDAMR